MMRALTALITKMFPDVALNAADLTPPNPPANSVAIYTDSYGDLWTKLPDGTTKRFAAASSGGGGVPTGSIFEFGGDTAPTGYLMANGAAVSRTTYADLFNVYGTKYGAGDGSTTFNLPNLADRVPVGVSASKALGSVGGAATVTLTTANLPAHAHSIGSHTHSLNDHTHTQNQHDHYFSHVHGMSHGHTARGRESGPGPQTTNATLAGSTATLHTAAGYVNDFAGSTAGPTSTNYTNNSTPTINGSGSLTTNSNTAATSTSNTGSGSSFSVQDPYVALNYIIKF